MKSNIKNYVLKLAIGGLLLAIGVLLPRITHLAGIPEIGQMLLPMHLGVMVAGTFLGKYYGLWIGFLTPFLNTMISGMPSYPMNSIMAFELAAYGFFSGLFMDLLPKIKLLGKDIKIYISLIISMIIGRMAYALTLWLAATMIGLNVPKPVSIIAATGLGIPGIVIQLILVPIIYYALNKVISRQN